MLSNVKDLELAEAPYDVMSIACNEGRFYLTYSKKGEKLGKARHVMTEDVEGTADFIRGFFNAQSTFEPIDLTGEDTKPAMGFLAP